MEREAGAGASEVLQPDTLQKVLLIRLALGDEDRVTCLRSTRGSFPRSGPGIIVQSLASVVGLVGLSEAHDAAHVDENEKNPP